MKVMLLESVLGEKPLAGRGSRHGLEERHAKVRYPGEAPRGWG